MATGRSKGTEGAGRQSSRVLSVTIVSNDYYKPFPVNTGDKAPVHSVDSHKEIRCLHADINARDFSQMSIDALPPNNPILQGSLKVFEFAES